MDKPPDSSGDQTSATQQMEFTLADVLAVFERRSDRAKPLTASDVMDAVNCSRRTAHNKLGELVETGALETRKVGARSRVWWIPMPVATDNAEPVASTQRDPTVDTQIADAELPGSGEVLKARRQAFGRPTITSEIILRRARWRFSQRSFLTTLPAAKQPTNGGR
jgi:hypothetical protein